VKNRRSRRERERGIRIHTDSQAREGWKVEEEVGEEAEKVEH
jgi:hypothetical protein